MSYQAIARKYRPETFGDVVGQTHVTHTLRAAMRKDKLSHAYLFSGPRGCGKTTVARLLAKAINCKTNREGDPCGTCEACVAIAKGSHLDVLEIDAASNTGVDNIRELRDMAQYSPSEGSSRVFIIDEVHMLSKGAFNALLKILEEPPARVYFFFATTEPNKIPRTILSRCQRFDFRLLSRDELGQRMTKITESEGATLDPAGLRLLVSLAEGSVRDALSLLDQVIAASDGIVDENAVVAAFGLVRSQVFLSLNEAIIARDAAGALRLVDELSTSGQSLEAFARGIVTNFRNLMLLRVDAELAPMVDLSPDQVEALGQHASHFSEQDLLALIDISARHFERIHRSTQPRIMLEASLVEYCRFESRVLLSDLAHRVERLAAGQPVSMGRPTATQTRSSQAPVAHGAPAAKMPTQGNVQGDPVAGWTPLVDTLMKKAPRVAACLMNGLPSLEGDILKVSFAGDKKFQVDNIKDDLPMISTVASEVLGKKIRVELVLGKQGQAAEVHDQIRQEVAPSHREELDRAIAGDKALGDLVETMGAEPLKDSDRDKWKSKDR